MTTITKRAEIDMTGYNVGNDPVTQGQIEVRWAKLTYLDDRLVSRESHRDVVWPETNLDARMAEVRDHLASGGEGLGFVWDSFAADLALLKTLADQIWTPQIVAARQAWLAEDRAA